MAFAAVMVTAVALDLSAANKAESSEMGGNFMDKIMIDRSVGSVPCDISEYPYQGKCCRNCPAGTSVLQHCSFNHGQSFCAPCKTGVSFTAYPNGIEACLPCSPCRDDDQVQVEACTATSNSKCQCRSGTYCIPKETCDLYCSPCKICPKGQQERYPCNATSDIICEETDNIEPAPETSTLLSVLLPCMVLLVVIVVLMVCVVLWRRRRQNEKQQQCDVPAMQESIPLSQEEEGHVTTAHSSANHCTEPRAEDDELQVQWQRHPNSRSQLPDPAFHPPEGHIRLDI